jgi:multidrug efflux pump subunit AcrA (membrane-fusion protein)
MNTKKKVFSLMVTLLAAALLLTACDALGAEETEAPAALPTVVAMRDTSVIVEGRIVPREDVDLFFMTGGEVAEVLVSEGDQVTRGQVLARLGDRESYQASITAAELELTLAQQAMDDLMRTTSLAYQESRQQLLQTEAAKLDAEEQLEELDTDAYQDKIDTANVKLADEEEDLQDAQEEFDKYANLDEDNPDRKNAEDALEDAQTAYDQAARERDRLVNDLEQAKVNVALTNAQYQEAQFRLEQRTDGPDAQQLAAVEARLNNAQAQLSAAQAAMDNLNLLAPFDGTIAKVSLTEGETVLPNRTVMVIADLTEWYVETTDLTENEVVSITVGQTALVVPDALPDVEMSAQVESIGQTYMEIAGDITYTARLLLADPDPQLRWGMTVEVEFSE